MLVLCCGDVICCARHSRCFNYTIRSPEFRSGGEKGVSIHTKPYTTLCRLYIHLTSYLSFRQDFGTIKKTKLIEHKSVHKRCGATFRPAMKRRRPLGFTPNKSPLFAMRYIQGEQEGNLAAVKDQNFLLLSLGSRVYFSITVIQLPSSRPIFFR